MIGWESIWQGLLWEACRRASPPSRQDELDTSPLARSAASLILARAAWEGYLNEFIEWRSLSPDLKNRSCYEGLAGVFAELGQSLTIVSEDTWDQLLLLNTLRNKVIHHKADRFKPGSGPHELLEKLAKLSLVDLPTRPAPWERLALSNRVAQWACLTVATAIVQLEAIPTKRSRSLHDVKEAVAEAIRPLKNKENLQ